MALPPETVIDGEVVALADDGRPSFSMLQNLGTNTGTVVLYAFNLPILAEKDLRQTPLEVRREEAATTRGNTWRSDPLFGNFRRTTSRADASRSVERTGRRGRQASWQPIQARRPFRGWGEGPR